MDSSNRQRRGTEPSGNRQAERFPIRVPIRFRQFGDSDWRTGITENISGAGVVFRCNQFAELHQRLEFNFVLRSRHNATLGTRVTCLGEIIRKEPQSETKGLYTIAATIEGFRLSPWVGTIM